MKTPKSHPRYKSLITREKLVKFVEKGLVVKEGLIAHGRGEAFDYLLGEKTIPLAARAEKAAAAHLLKAKSPVISVNGNAAALASKPLVELSRVINAKLEANVFYGDRDKRIKIIIGELKKSSAKIVLGLKPDARIPQLKGQRSLCSSEGIYSSDVVLVPLEDGDRTEALASMGKIIIAIDLNPLSRTSLAADVSIVDELTRALPKIMGFVKTLKNNRRLINKAIKEFDNEKNLSSIIDFIGNRLTKL